MKYTEALPDNVFTHHIESYWSMPHAIGCASSPIELLLPTCTFNILFTDQPCYVRLSLGSPWVPHKPGAVFFGQRNSCIQIKSEVPINISGVRFKPFAFANIVNSPLCQLNDTITPLENIFSYGKVTSLLINQILSVQEFSNLVGLFDELMHNLFGRSLSIDEKLRAQLNYILDRKGSVRIGSLIDEFRVSKVTLHKHFIKKVGLTPKKVSQIWRMNHFLQLREEQPNERLTLLCLNVGYYDQAHFIKEFKALFGLPPRKFFLQSPNLVKVAHHNISRRFTNQYDPRIG